MAMALPRQRRMRLWPLYLLIAVAVLWIGYWYASREIVGSAVANTLAAMASKGRVVTCSEQATGGFPFSLDLDCTQGSFGDRRADMTAGLGRFTASAPLYWPGSVTASLAGPFVFDAPIADVALEASWSKALANVDAGLGGLKGFALSVDDLTVARKGESRGVPFLSLGATHADLALAPGNSDGYRVTGTASGIAIRQNEKRAFPAFSGALDATAIGFGGGLGEDPGRAFVEWLKAGGTLRIDKLTLSAMNASAEASGTLSLSPKGLLSGDIKLRIVGLDDIPEVAGQIRPGYRKKTAQIVGAVGMFATPVKDKGGEPALELPLTIRNGALSIGILPLADIPRLKF